MERMIVSVLMAGGEQKAGSVISTYLSLPHLMRKIYILSCLSTGSSAKPMHNMNGDIWELILSPKLCFQWFTPKKKNDSALITEPVDPHYNKSKSLFSHTLGLYINAWTSLNSSCQLVTAYNMYKSIYLQSGKHSVLLLA